MRAIVIIGREAATVSAASSIKGIVNGSVTLVYPQIPPTRIQSKDVMKTAISRHLVERNDYFHDNPKRAGKHLWEIGFFRDIDSLDSGSYRQ